MRRGARLSADRDAAARRLHDRKAIVLIDRKYRIALSAELVDEGGDADILAIVRAGRLQSPHCIMKDDEAEGTHVAGIKIPIGFHLLVAVVTVDEQEVDRFRYLIGRLRGALPHDRDDIIEAERLQILADRVVAID